MSKEISVVGLGPGNLDYMTKAGIDKIKNSEIVIGGKRQLEEIAVSYTHLFFYSSTF